MAANTVTYYGDVTTVGNTTMTQNLTSQGTLSLFTGNVNPATSLGSNIGAASAPFGTSYFTSTNVNSANVLSLLGSIGVNGATDSATSLKVTGNVYASNALSASRIFASTSMNVSGQTNTSAIYGPTGIVGINTTTGGAVATVIGNIYASNALSAPRIFASTSMNVSGQTNTSAIYGPTGIVGINTTTGGAGVTVIGNIYASNALTAPRIFAATSMNISGQINTSAIYGPAGTVGINTTTGGANLTVIGNIYASNAVSILNAISVTTNSSSLNVLSVKSFTGIGTATNLGATLTVQGNIVVSNALSTTNIAPINLISKQDIFSTNVTATTILKYNEDITRRSPHLRPSSANATTIQNWIRATCNATSKSLSSAGGLITYVNGYKIHLFTTVGTSTFTINSQIGSAQILVVAGGGGGGYSIGGGGGAGGLLYYSSATLSAGSYTVTVGGGGAGSADTHTIGGSGGNSSLIGGATSITANGGGGGTGQSAEYDIGVKAGSGGSGGGGSRWDSLAPPGYGTGISGQGNNGGPGQNASPFGGGGGGGAGAVGGSAGTGSPSGGLGGAGLAITIAGITSNYAGGGGGAGQSVAAGGGTGGGGNGSVYYSSSATGGTPNTGGGGGGGDYGQGGAGGSGIVVIAYPGVDVPTFNTVPTGLTGTGLYSSSLIGPDGRVYFTPSSATNVGVFNPKTNGFSSIVPSGVTLAGGAGQYGSSVLCPNGNIAFISNTVSTGVLTFNPITYAASTLTSLGSGGFNGGILGPDGKVYCPAYTTGSPTLLIYDPLTMVSSYNTNFILQTQNSGGVLTPSGYIVEIPWNSSYIRSFDATSTTPTSGITFTHGQTTPAFSGGVLVPDGNVVCVPYSSLNIGLYNPNLNTFTAIPHGCGSGAFSGGVLTPTGFVILVPFNSSNVGLFDPGTRSFSNLVSVGTGGANYAGGTLLPDGRVIMAPYNASGVGILNTLTPVSREFCAAPYFNKF